MLKQPSVVWGCDPEGFFQQDGLGIIGSEHIIPEKGLVSYGGRVVRDGIQFELNPFPSTDLKILRSNIGDLYRTLTGVLKRYPGVSINYQGLVTVTPEEFARVSEKSRVLGCMPSDNFYGTKPIDIDGKAYSKRSAGAHIHMGLSGPLLAERERLVPLMDIFVGNTGVMLDRDPGSAERRQNYGRAGEYRRPKHGLEYRTLSNFWLRDYRLMSLMYGMTSLAVAVLQETLTGSKNLEQDIANLVDIDAVRLAIDTNDFDMAVANFKVIMPFLTRHADISMFPVGASAKFVYFCNSAREKGIGHFFPTESIAERWMAPAAEDFTAFLYRL